MGLSRRKLLLIVGFAYFLLSPKQKKTLCCFKTQQSFMTLSALILVCACDDTNVKMEKQKNVGFFFKSVNLWFLFLNFVHVNI